MTRRLRTYVAVSVAAGVAAVALPPLAAPAAAQARHPATTPRETVPVIRFRTVEDPPRAVWVGDTLAVALPPDPLPPNAPDSLRRRGRRARWRSYDPEIVRVDSTGTAVALLPGDARVECWTPLGARVVPLHVRAALRGVVLAPDGASPNARVIAVVADGADTVHTDTHGGFLIPLDRRADDVREVRVEPAGADASRYHRARLVAMPPTALGGVRVVLVPTAWRVRGGSYDGTVVPVEPGLAAAAVRERGGFWNVARDQAIGGWPVGWAPERLPLPLAFASDASEIVAVDSVLVWLTARQLERDWGTPLFRPASRADADAPDFAGIVVRIDPTIPATGFATTSWDGTGELSLADVRVRRRSGLHDPQVLTHELLHALGLGHATGWGSVMSSRVGTITRMSATDVAYAQLVAAMRRTQRAADAPFGLAEAEP